MSVSLTLPRIALKGVSEDVSSTELTEDGISGQNSGPVSSSICEIWSYQIVVCEDVTACKVVQLFDVSVESGASLFMVWQTR